MSIPPEPHPTWPIPTLTFATAVISRTLANRDRNHWGRVEPHITRWCVMAAVSLQAELLLLLLIFAIGVGITAQTAINVELGKALGSSIYSAFLSFAIGAVILTFVMFIEACKHNHPLIQIKLRRVQDVAKNTSTKASVLKILPLLSGGLFGATLVTLAIVLSPKVGLALYFAFVTAGQLCMALTFDHTGFLGLPKKRVHWTQLLFCVLALAGCGMSVIERAMDSSDSLGQVFLGAFGGFVGGCLLPLQTAVNRLLADYMPSKTQASLLSFYIGALALGIVSAVMSLLSSNLDDQWKFEDSRWYQYLSGFAGVFIVLGSVVLAPVVGVSLFFLAIIAGQLSASLVFDNFGAIGFDTIRATPLRIIGTIVVFFATVGMQISARNFSVVPALSQPEEVEMQLDDDDSDDSDDDYKDKDSGNGSDLKVEEF
eukprot:m.173302 g.173302  ORF g.173302 m.173302 type:complete len:428 (+) comp25244_c0_seq2:1753-3036(+)